MGLGPLADSALGGERLSRNRIGIQLFTVRTLAEADLPGALALLASIGYREIEVAGLFGRTPAQFRALMDANRLRAVGGHQLVGPALIPFFGARAVEDALDEAEALGQPYVGHRGDHDPDRHRGGRRRAADRRSLPRARRARQRVGRRRTARRLRLYLHVHYWEFGRPTTGESLFQILLDETDPRLVSFEPDLFWMVFGGIDPLDWIPRYQHRFPLFHVKDGNPNPAGGYFTPGSPILARDRSTSPGSSGRSSTRRASLHRRARRPARSRADSPGRVRVPENLRARKRHGGMGSRNHGSRRES